MRVRLLCPLACLLVLLLTLSVAAAAEDEPEEDEIVIVADESDEGEDEEEDDEMRAGEDVVVTGTRTQHQVSDSPVATSVVTQGAVESAGAVDAGDALESVPGVFVDEYESASRGGPGTGVNLHGLPTDRILVLIDGQRVPWTMRAPDLELIPSQLIRRIEVVKGPSSSLYGSDAVGGVINILTREPTADPAAQLDLSGGSFSTFGANTFHSWSAGPVGWVLNFNREQSQGWIDANANRPIARPGEGIIGFVDVPYEDGHPYELNDLFGKVRFQLNPHLSFRTQARYHWEDNQFADTDDGAVSDDKIRLSGLLGAELVYGPVTVDLTGTYFHRSFRYREFSTAYSENPLDPDELLRSTVDKGNTTVGDDFGGELVVSAVLADWNLLTGGVNWRHERLDYEAFEHSVMTDAEQSYDAYQTVLSAFVQDEIFLFDNVWSLVPGVRVDNHEVWGTTVNPKLSTMVKPAASTALRASIGRAFREPTLSQLYRPVFRHSGYFMRGNDDLEPETALGWNAELDQTFGGWARLVGGYFQYELTDMIWTTIIDDDYIDGYPLMAYTNLKRARVYGGEGTLQITPWQYLRWTAGYTWTRTFDLDEDESLGTVPEHNASSQLFVDYHPWGLGGYVGASYQSQRDYIGMGGRWYTADPRWLTNLRLYKTLGDHVELGFRVTNWLGYWWDREGDGDNDLPPTGYYGELKLEL